jgi:hypothetical protein
MRKALLIGINYVGTKAALNGCINDCSNLGKMLKTKYGYEDNDITMLTDNTDNKPTKANIIAELKRHVAMTKNDDVSELWISYSGHGSYVRDTNSDESDRKDECLVPLDYASRGMISDDFLHMLVEQISVKTKTVVLIDACHSGSMLDLKYRYTAGLKEVVENPRDNVRSNIVMISGCMDSQTSADWNNSGVYEGAMTRSFLNVMEQYNYDITCYKLLGKMREFLEAKKFTQYPQLCCTRKLGNTTAFSIRKQENQSYLEVQE